ncbi:unnamed protein product [Prorocentrum cordatum]|uniref:Uncharacterized protein n=1 Tax=Prorocentrum cordatum TaxID=2364126 RepID=A0ABN9SGB6_9DINO|nr:unnamed protein product [Polarella glacialis]
MVSGVGKQESEKQKEVLPERVIGGAHRERGAIRIRGASPWPVPATSSSAEAAPPPSAEEFVRRWGLDEKAALLLEKLPREVSAIVLGRFSAHGTKVATAPIQGCRQHERTDAQSDGLRWRRTEDAQRSVQARGWEFASTVNHLLAIQATIAGTVVELEHGLAVARDGNVWGRLLGFVLSVWIQKQGVDEEAAAYLRGVHEAWGAAEARAKEHPAGLPGPPVSNRPEQWAEGDRRVFLKEILGGIATLRFFHLRLSYCDRQIGPENRDAAPDLRVQLRVHQRADNGQEQETEQNSVLDAFQCIAEAALDAAGGASRLAVAPAAEAARGAAEDVDAFVQRCGLEDQPAAEFLRGLLPEVRAVILADFDPGGTKDGNVFGRLQGFARSLEGSRKRGGLSAPGSKRPRTGP